MGFLELCEGQRSDLEVHLKKLCLETAGESNYGRRPRLVEEHSADDGVRRIRSDLDIYASRDVPDEVLTAAKA